MKNGNDIESIRKIMSELPLLVIAPNGKTFELKIEIDMKDVNSEIFYIKYLHVATKGELIKEKFLIGSEPYDGIDNIREFFINNNFRVFKGSETKSLVSMEGDI